MIDECVACNGAIHLQHATVDIGVAGVGVVSFEKQRSAARLDQLAHAADVDDREHGWHAGAASEVPGEQRQIWPDLSVKELLTLLPLAVLTIYLGVYPQAVLRSAECAGATGAVLPRHRSALRPLPRRTRTR